MVTDFNKATDEQLMEERRNLAKAIRANERDVEELCGAIEEQNAKLRRMKLSLSRKRRKAGIIKEVLKKRHPNQHKSGERNKVLGEALSQLCIEISAERGVPASSIADDALSNARRSLGLSE